MTSDYVDSIANLPVDNFVRNYATPIPVLITAVNVAFNEYLVFKRETVTPRFFQVNHQKYLQINAAEIREVADPELRAEMLSLLVANGYKEATHELSTSLSDSARLRNSNSVRRKLKSTFKAAVTGPVTKAAWLFLARTLGINPPGENGFEFGKLEEAIDYSENISRGNFKKWRAPHDLLLARELPITPIRPASK